jgi:flagellar protein FlgJ
MRDARFAELTAQTGQLGFASAIEKQLARFLPKGEN